MRILVTGACGFIGSHLVEKLIKNNYKVRALTYYNPHDNIGCLKYLNKKIFDKIEIINGDVRDYQLIENCTKNTDAVIHLAALIGIPYSYSAAKSYLDTNVNGTFNILNAANTNKVKKILITSTSEVYGSAKEVPIKETHSLNAQSPYAASKIAADQLALSFFNSFKTPVTIIRPFNTYGPRQSNRAIIPTIINQLINGNKNLKLGNIYPTRDFTYVEDTADAFIKLLKARKTEGEIINIGSNFEISIKKVLEVLKKDFKYKFNIITEEKRVRSKSSEVNRLFASNKKAKKIINWSPQYSHIKGFKLGLKKTIEWYTVQKITKKFNVNTYSV